MFFILLFKFNYSQNLAITVIDSITKNPIPYTNILFNDGTGTYSNYQGIFFIKKDINTFKISNIAYFDKKAKVPLKDTIISLRPHNYEIQEIIVKPLLKKINLGYNKYKSEFTYSGLSGDEIAVFIPNNTEHACQIQDLFIVFDTRKVVKKGLGIDFTSVFKLNFYSSKDYKPDTLLLKKEIIVKTNTIHTKKYAIDLSKYEILMPYNGIFVSIEWVGILSPTNELRTDYKNRTEPFVSTTFKQTNSKVYARNKFKSMKWNLVDKNNRFSKLLKKENYYTPCIGVSVK